MSEQGCRRSRDVEPGPARCSPGLLCIQRRRQLRLSGSPEGSINRSPSDAGTSQICVVAATHPRAYSPGSRAAQQFAAAARCVRASLYPTPHDATRPLGMSNCRVVPARSNALSCCCCCCRCRRRRRVWNITRMAGELLARGGGESHRLRRLWRLIVVSAEPCRTTRWLSRWHDHDRALVTTGYR